MNNHSLIQYINDNSLTKYCSIILIIIFLLWIMSISLNVILIIILFIIIVIYYFQKNKLVKENFNDKENIKFGNIKPPLEISNKIDINDFLFSIQDFYIYNPQAHEELIDNINAFFSIYSNILMDNDLSNYYYQIAESKKNNALNSLHSIIFNLPTNKLYTEKLNRAHQRLETILNKYLNELFNKCNQYTLQFGRNIYKKQINTGPKEYNTYLNKDFSYQFY